MGSNCKDEIVARQLWGKEAKRIIASPIRKEKIQYSLYEIPRSTNSASLHLWRTLFLLPICLEVGMSLGRKKK